MVREVVRRVLVWALAVVSAGGVDSGGFACCGERWVSGLAEWWGERRVRKIVGAAVRKGS